MKSRLASEAINLPPERVVWCYSQWQPAYTEMLVAIPHIVKGIPAALEQEIGKAWPKSLKRCKISKIIKNPKPHLRRDKY